MIGSGACFLVDPWHRLDRESSQANTLRSQFGARSSNQKSDREGRAFRLRVSRSSPEAPWTDALAMYVALRVRPAKRVADGGV